MPVDLPFYDEFEQSSDYDDTFVESSNDDS